MRMYKRPETANFRRRARFSNRGRLGRINLIGKASDESEGSSECNDDNVLRLDGTGWTEGTNKQATVCYND